MGVRTAGGQGRLGVRDGWGSGRLGVRTVERWLREGKMDHILITCMARSMRE